MSSEPLLTYSAIGAAIGAVLLGVLKHYTSMPDDLTTAIVDLSVLLVPVMIGAIAARGKVRPIAKMSAAEREEMANSLEAEAREKL